MPRVLLVDDEPAIRLAVGDYLQSSGFEVVRADSFEGCLAAFREAQPDAVVLDHRLGAVSAVDLLHVLKEMEPDVPVIVLTGHGTIDLAVRAIKEGAEQFLTKPIELAALAVALRRALENRRNRQRHLAASASQARHALDPFLGESAAIRRLEAQARRVIASEAPLLVLGETGTGKGVLARWLHANGPRAEEPFIDLNCAGLGRDLLESELFGHERGAFTGASAAKVGLLEAADRGTVFLDELGDMDPAVQPKLLKALEEKRFRRLGEVRDRRVDVRVIAATHRDLRRLVDEGRFREDLYYRLSAISLRMPPLRERTEDIPVIARSLLQAAARTRAVVPELSPAAVAALRSYGWPGNVRELRNVLERAVLLTEGAVLAPEDLHFEPAREAGGQAWHTRLTLAEVERHHIEAVLREEGGQVAAAAARLEISRSSLYSKLKQYGLSGRPGPQRGR